MVTRKQILNKIAPSRLPVTLARVKATPPLVGQQLAAIWFCASSWSSMRSAYAKSERSLSTVMLKQEGRQIAEADISSEKHSVTVTATSEEWAHKTDEEKLLAFITQVARRNDLFKAALRETLRE